MPAEAFQRRRVSHTLDFRTNGVGTACNFIVNIDEPRNLVFVGLRPVVSPRAFFWLDSTVRKMSNIRQILDGLVRPELNMLYTEIPAWKNGGMDEGWFCREHAYHTYFLTRMLGYSAHIVLGHFGVHFSGREVRRSYGTDCDHAWNIVSDMNPTDLSITFVHHHHLFEQPAQLAGGVFGEGTNGAFEIRRYSDEEVFTRAINDPGETEWVGYFPISQFSESDEKLLRDPYCFFLPTDDGGWGQVFGMDIFAKINLHLLKVSLRQVRPLHKTMNSQMAIRQIQTGYKAAVPRVLKGLKRFGSTN